MKTLVSNNISILVLITFSFTLTAQMEVPLLDSVLEWSITVDGDSTLVDKVLYSYNDQGWNTEIIFQDYLDGQYINTNRFTYEYNADGNRTNYSTYVFTTDGEWSKNGGSESAYDGDVRTYFLQLQSDGDSFVPWKREAFVTANEGFAKYYEVFDEKAMSWDTVGIGQYDGQYRRLFRNHSLFGINRYVYPDDQTPVASSDTSYTENEDGTLSVEEYRHLYYNAFNRPETFVTFGVSENGKADSVEMVTYKYLSINPEKETERKTTEWVEGVSRVTRLTERDYNESEELIRSESFSYDDELEALSSLSRLTYDRTEDSVIYEFHWRDELWNRDVRALNEYGQITQQWSYSFRSSSEDFKYFELFYSFPIRTNSQLQQTSSPYSIYPNPSRGLVFVDGPSWSSYRLYAVDGRLLEHRQSSEGPLNFDKYRDQKHLLLQLFDQDGSILAVKQIIIH